jgi:valyl-tRNA synthetase
MDAKLELWNLRVDAVASGIRATPDAGAPSDDEVNELFPMPTDAEVAAWLLGGPDWFLAREELYSARFNAWVDGPNARNEFTETPSLPTLAEVPFPTAEAALAWARSGHDWFIARQAQ